MLKHHLVSWVLAQLSNINGKTCCGNFIFLLHLISSRKQYGAIPQSSKVDGRKLTPRNKLCSLQSGSFSLWNLTAISELDQWFQAGLREFRLQMIKSILKT